MSDDNVWELRKGETLIGTLRVFEQDMFWYSANFEPSPTFVALRPIFDEGNTIRMEDSEQSWSAWGMWCEKVAQLGLRLVRLYDHTIATQFILYIEDGQAEFRPHFDALPDSES
jgi:hypothetical protein